MRDDVRPLARGKPELQDQSQHQRCQKKCSAATTGITTAATLAWYRAKYSIGDMPTTSAATLEAGEAGPRSRHAVVPMTAAAATGRMPSLTSVGYIATSNNMATTAIDLELRVNAMILTHEGTSGRLDVVLLLVKKLSLISIGQGKK